MIIIVISALISSQNPTVAMLTGRMEPPINGLVSSVDYFDDDCDCVMPNQRFHVRYAETRNTVLLAAKHERTAGRAGLLERWGCNARVAKS